MRNHDQGRPALPVRLTSAEREFFVALRRLVDTSGLSVRRLADTTSPARLADATRLPGPSAPEPDDAFPDTRYTATQWQNWLNGQSLPPRKAVRMLTEALAIADIDTGNLAELWALAFMPTPYPQEAAPAVARPRQGQADETGAPDDVLAGQAQATGPKAHSSDDLGAAQAAIARSYSQLSDPAARMFRLLSVHPGPYVSPPAAASLAAADPQEARRALDELAAAGLLEERVPGRFACHDAQLRYAAERARASEPAGSPEMALGRLLDHYLATLVAAVSLGYPGPSLPVPVPAPRPGVLPEAFDSEVRARAWCHAELPALQSLLARAAERDLSIYCWQIPSAMSMFLVRNGLMHDFLAGQRIALAAADKLGDPLALGHAHYHFAHACALLGEVADSGTHLQEALEHFVGAGDKTAAATTLNGMAQLFMQQGEYARALDREEEALRLRLTLGNRDAVAHSEETIASIYARLGEYDLALRHCYRSLDISRETGARLLAADALITLGFVCLALGDPRRAIASYMEVLAIYRQAGTNVLVITALTGLGDAQQVAGDRDAARASWQRALALLKDLPSADDQPVRARLARHHSGLATAAFAARSHCRRAGYFPRAGYCPRAAAAARAAAGRASAIRDSAPSSCAAETNQASNAEGGRYTPPSSIAWKNAAYAAVDWSLASA
jgi:tetratricopeptide (TPR) repeat protein